MTYLWKCECGYENEEYFALEISEMKVVVKCVGCNRNVVILTKRNGGAEFLYHEDENVD